MKRPLVHVLSSLIVFSLLGVGCGDNEPNNPDGEGGENATGDGDTGTGGGSGDGDGDTGTAGDSGDGDTSTCDASQKLCDDVCTNTSSDPDHCGACGNACDAGEGCSEGECKRFGCAPGEVECNGSCIDLQRDPEFCGSCTTACDAGEVCSSGSCLTSCPGDQMACNGTCIDPDTDNQYCGATLCTAEAGMGGASGADEGTNCSGGQMCQAGVCEASCSSGAIVCGDECVDPQKDREFCGATSCETGSSSGEACASGEVCVSGVCETSCPGDEVECEGLCIDPQSDEGHCGASACGDDATDGETCGAGDLCSLGVCEANCSVGHLVCDDNCVDPEKDREYCGATDCTALETSGTACLAGEVCVDGACETSCPSGQIECDDVCVDPDSDETHCGATVCGQDATDGESCGAGSLCEAGVCEVSCGAGLLACGDSCIDPLGNPDFCGATDCTDSNGMGVQCGSDESCVIGECREFVPEWSLGERVDIIDLHSVYFSQRIATNAAGQAVVVWRQATIDDPDGVVEFKSNRLYASVYDPNTKSWSDQVLVSDAAVDVRTMDVDMASDGKALVVWIEGGATPDSFPNRLLASTFNGTTWSAPTRVDDGSDPNSIDSPDLDMDAQGNAYLVWVEGVSTTPNWATTTTRGRRFVAANGTFDATIHTFARATGFGNTSPYGYVVSPHVEVNSSGHAAVSVLEFADVVGRAANAPVVTVADLSTAGDPVWLAPVDLQAVTKLAGLRDAIDVGIDDQDNVHVAYAAGTRFNRNLHMDYYSAATSTWAPTHTTNFSGDSGGTRVVRYLDLDVQAGGDAWVAFQVEGQDTGAAPRHVYAQPFDSGSSAWGSYALISEATTNAATAARPIPSIASDQQGNVFVSWVRYGATNLADANRYDASTNTWSGAVVLNDTPLGTGSTPHIAVSSGGVAFSSWVQVDSALGGTHLFVARFN